MDNAVEPIEGWKEVPNEAYHNGPGYSSTDLRLVLKSPAHLKCKDKYETTDAQLEGSGAHAAVLEGWPAFHAQYETLVGKRTAKAKEDAAARGVSLLTAHQSDNVLAWAKAVLEHEPAKGVLEFEGSTEISGYWRDPRTGLLCKCRPDKLIPSLGAVVDLKFMTIRDSVDLGYKFQGAIVNYSYHIQAAYYLMGAGLIDKTRAYDTFIWIVIGKEPPHMVGCYMADGEMLAEGRADIIKALDRIKKAEELGDWPKPFTGGINTISFPSWKRKSEGIYD